MSSNVLKIGSRDSALAIRQSELVRDSIKKNNPELVIEIITMKTTGDRILDKPLDLVGGRGLFVKELEQALINGDCDLTVHSLKDMTMMDNELLPVFAYTDREDPRDVLVLSSDLRELPEKPVIGTSSRRRVLQAKQLFPQAEFKSLRGNVITRLRKLDEGQYDAIIIASAGLKRLGLEERISRYFTVDEIVPAACQGIMAVQGNKNIANIAAMSEARAINNKTSELIAKTERELVRRLGGGCSSPNCAYAEIHGTEISLTGVYFDENSELIRKDTVSGKVEEAEALALTLADKLVSGRVYLVGGGPGDPGLMTVKGRKLVEEADVIITDALLGDSLLSIIPRTARVINAGKRKGRHSMKQEEINALLVEEGKKGGKVVRLKGGDPFVFGRGGEEAEILKKNHIPFEIVPGVTSAVAVPAYSGIPITQRGVARNMQIVTAHIQGMPDGTNEFPYIDFEALCRMGGTTCFLMGFEAIPALTDKLLQAGMAPEMPCTVISQGTTASHKELISTISHVVEDLETSDLTAPAIFLVGEACAMSDSCSWLENLPLAGKKIVVTRPSNQSSSMANRLRELGAEVLEDPAVRLRRFEKGSDSYEKIADALKHLQDYAWIGFTSPTGAEFFFEYLQELKIDIRKLADVRIAVIGESTANVFEKRNIFPDLVPEVYYTSAMAEALADRMGKGEKVLLLRAFNAGQDLAEVLEDKHVSYDDVRLYEALPEENTFLSERIRENFEEHRIDYVMFTSAYGVQCFDRKMKLTDDEKKTFLCVCIGEKTARTAENSGYRTVVSEKQTADSMVSLITNLTP